MIIYKLKKVKSTQDYAKRLIKKHGPRREDFVVIAQCQTGGKGTKGRSFSSKPGGAYLTAVTFHTAKGGDKCFEVNKSAAMAVIKSLLAFDVKGGIKWPNDVFVNGKKICGMLIENTFIGQYMDYSMVGVGVNVNNDLPDELKDIAISLKDVLGREISLSSFVATLIYNLQNPEDLGLYADYSIILGKNITVTRPDGEVFSACAKEILPDGRLLLDSGEVLTAAEISVRL